MKSFIEVFHNEKKCCFGSGGPARNLIDLSGDWCWICNFECFCRLEFS